MGNIDYSLKTNITVQKEGIFPTCLDHLIFQTADGSYLEVESQGRDEFTHNNGELVGQWQDHVMYRRLDACLDYIGDGDFSDIDRDDCFYGLIMDPATKMVGFRVDEESLSEHGYSDDFVPECSNASVWITFIHEKHGSGVHTPRFKADKLLTDGALEATIKESLGRGGS
jgi:hypothetical protein